MCVAWRNKVIYSICAVTELRYLHRRTAHRSTCIASEMIHNIHQQHSYNQSPRPPIICRLLCRFCGQPITRAYTAGMMYMYTVHTHLGKGDGMWLRYNSPESAAVHFSIIRPRRSSAAAYSDQTFPWTICRSVRRSVQCIVEKRRIISRCRLAS